VMEKMQVQSLVQLVSIAGAVIEPLQKAAAVIL